MEGTNLDIRYEDLLNITTTFNDNITALFEEIETMKTWTNLFTQDTSFSGQSAESIKAYFNERHIPMLDAIKATAQTLLDTVAIYKDMYAQLEPTTNFRIPQEGLEEYASNMNLKLSDVANENNGLFKQIKDALNSVNTIYTDYSYPDSVEFGIEYNHGQISTEIQTYIENALYIEDEIKNRIGSDFLVAMEVIVATNAVIGTNWGTITQYQPGSLANNSYYQLLNSNTEALNANHEANSDYFTMIWDREAQLAEMAAQRQKAGVTKIIVGVGVCIVGVACIVVSCGTATPVVATVAGCVIGGTTTASSVFIVGEGISDINLASKGDLDSRPVNPVKNVLYEATGSDDIYYLVETTLVALSASFVCGITIGSFGVNLSSLAPGLNIGRGVMTFANIGLPTAAGIYVGNQTYETTGNGYLGVVAGGVTSYTAGVSLPFMEQQGIQMLGGTTYLYEYNDPYCQGVFRQEFTRRAVSNAGLSRTDARLAYNAFKEGDYDTMASILDLSTPTDGAVFWSGVPGEVSNGFAESVGGKTIAMTPGGSMFNDWRGFNEMYPGSAWGTGLPNDQRPIWVALSREFASGATGQVYHVVPIGGTPNPASIWYTDEIVVLEDLKKITNIVEVPK